MSIKGISFDLEGPLIDLEPFHHGGHIAAANDIGIKLTIDDCLDKIPHFIGGPDEKIAEEIATLAGAKPEIFLERTGFHYNRFLEENDISLRPGAEQFISHLIKKGYQVSIGSAVAPYYGKILISRTGLEKLFPKSLILFEGDVSRTKPAPDVYLETARRMNVLPEEQLVFEDSPRGVKAAATAGSKVVGMPIYWKPHTVAELIQSGASRVFPDWREINIDHLLSNLQD